MMVWSLTGTISFKLRGLHQYTYGRTHSPCRKSPIPVRPDLLQPNFPCMPPPSRPHAQGSPEVIKLDGSERLTPASQNSARRGSSRSSIASSSRQTAPLTEIIDVDMLEASTIDVPISLSKGMPYRPLPRRSNSGTTNASSQRPSPATRPSNGTSSLSPVTAAPPQAVSQPDRDPLKHIVGTPPLPLSPEDEGLQREALTFLRRYIRLFDRDRAALASAYSHVATFSVATHDPSSPASWPSPRTVAQRLSQGRADVVTALLAIPAARKFMPEGPRDVEYDVVCLDNKTDVLLMCYAGETKDRDGKVWACDQRFVLRKKEWDPIDRFVHGPSALFSVANIQFQIYWRCMATGCSFSPDDDKRKTTTSAAADDTLTYRTVPTRYASSEHCFMSHVSMHRPRLHDIIFLVVLRTASCYTTTPL